MRTNIDINETLLNEAFQYVNIKTKKELINTALSEFVLNHRKKN